MYNIDSENMFDVIDLDPYGSMVPFLHSTIKSLKNNGLLCVTSTDSRVLCGSDRHKCFYLYRCARGGNDMVQETGLRIALQTINTVAAMMGKNIQVLMSVQSDFYIRLYIKVIRKKKEAWKSIAQNGMQFYCKSCCYQHYHVFGAVQNNGHYKVNKFELPTSKCPTCDSELLVSSLTRRSFMGRSTIRTRIRPETVRRIRQKRENRSSQNNNLQKDKRVFTSHPSRTAVLQKPSFL